MDKIVRLGTMIVLILFIAGCGVRGPLEPYPSKTKSEKSVKDTNVKEDKKKHKPFILDGLL